MYSSFWQSLAHISDKSMVYKEDKYCTMHKVVAIFELINVTIILNKIWYDILIQ